MENSPTNYPSTREIAKAAGVSHVTVSRVLRNHPMVKESTRKKVLSKAEELGYRPNPLLGILMQQLRSRKSNDFVATIGWLNTHPNKSEWHECPWRRKILIGAQKRAAQMGYSLNEFWAGEPGMTPERIKKILQWRSIYGILVDCMTGVDFLEQMDCSDLAVCVVGQPKNNEMFSYVESDTSQGMMKVIQSLWELGYRRIGLVLAPLHTPTGHPWRATFLSVQEDWPRKNLVPVLRLSESLEACQDEYRKWLQKHKPDAVIGCDALLKPIAESCGFSVPEDLAIAHLHIADDVADWSGIDSNDMGMGSTAVDVVAASIQRNELGPPGFPKRILVPVRWVAGNTTCPL